MTFKRWAKASTQLAALLAIVIYMISPLSWADYTKPYSPTFAGMVIDARTGQVLYQNNAYQALHPASLTKIMTLLMVFEALERRELSLNDRITISNRAASMAPSKLGLRPGATITVRNAIYALVTKSCNDIAVALAENMDGSESAFARRMTARARELGMNQTFFANASGLPNSNQWSSAYDMARLARYIILHHPTYYRFFSAKNFYYAGQVLHNHNKLMNSYVGMDGIKSGYVVASGFNLVASAVRNNHRLIGVVFGGKTANSRNAQMAQLLDNSFKTVGERVDEPNYTILPPVTAPARKISRVKVKHKTIAVIHRYKHKKIAKSHKSSTKAIRSVAQKNSHKKTIKTHTFVTKNPAKPKTKKLATPKRPAKKILYYSSN